MTRFRSTAQGAPASPWVRRAQRGALPYKVHADLRTDARVHVVRETQADILRRTLPPVASPAGDLCVICRDPRTPVGPAGHDWAGGRAHGYCIIMEGKGQDA